MLIGNNYYFSITFASANDELICHILISYSQLVILKIAWLHKSIIQFIIVSFIILELLF